MGWLCIKGVIDIQTGPSAAPALTHRTENENLFKYCLEMESAYALLSDGSSVLVYNAERSTFYTYVYIFHYYIGLLLVLWVSPTEQFAGAFLVQKPVNIFCQYMGELNLFDTSSVPSFFSFLFVNNICCCFQNVHLQNGHLLSHTAHRSLSSA